MKKEIFRTAIDLILAITFLTVSIPIWDAYAARMPDIIETPASLALNTEKLTAESIFNINSTKKNLKEAEFIVNNYSNKTKTGKLLFKYAKASTLDYRYLNIIIDGEINNITTYLMSSDALYYIFIIDNVELPKYELKKYTFGLWLDESLGEKIISKEFTYKLEMQ